MDERERGIQRLWRDQAREEYEMSIEMIRVKADQLDRRVRNMNRATAGLLAVIVLVEAWQIWGSPELLERVGDLLTLAAFAYVAFRFRGDVTVQSMPAGLGLTSSMDFYRDQLARRRDLSEQPWRFLVPFVPGVGLSLLGGMLNVPPAQAVAVAAFGMLLFLAIAWWEKRRARGIQHEIDGLD
jgi:hypothetical protein